MIGWVAGVECGEGMAEQAAQRELKENYRI